MIHKRVQQKEEKKQEGERPYAPPAIIYTGQISTRAGSPLGGDGGPDPVDPMDLFSE